MAKRVIIIHGWGGSPKEPMFQWLKSRLEENGTEVVVPAMPDTEKPVIKDWVKRIKEVVEKSDKDTILVGHSIGCQAILRYLEKLHPAKRIGGIVFIAPWLTLSNLRSDKEWQIVKPWLDIPISDTDVIKHTPSVIAIFSDNDPYVPMDNIELFKRRFNAKIIIESQKGHFTEEDGVKSLPSALKAILEDN